jgi:hypothetical protein
VQTGSFNNAGVKQLSVPMYLLLCLPSNTPSLTLACTSYLRISSINAVTPYALLQATTYEVVLLSVGFKVLLGLFFDPEDGGHMFLQNVSEHLPDYR